MWSACWEVGSRGRPRESSGLGKDSRPTPLANSSQTHTRGVFLSAPEVTSRQGYCFPWPLPLIRQRKTAPTITLRLPALPAAYLPGWSPCLLYPFLSLLPETVIQAKMSVGPRTQRARSSCEPWTFSLSDPQSPRQWHGRAGCLRANC